MSWRDQDNRRAAIIAGACTLVAGLGAAFITVMANTPRSGAQSVPTVTITQTVTVTQAVTASPSADATASTPPQAVPQPTPTSGQPPIPLLRPVLSQPGWTLAWHQRVYIGPQGITFGGSAPDIGDGSNYDLHYVPGTDTGWGCGGQVVAFSSWPYKYSPGPATINGISGSSTGCDVGGMQVHIGDRLYGTLTTWVSVDRIAYMQIVGKEAGNIVAETWVWNKA